jgi:hypothetical protein
MRAIKLIKHAERKVPDTRSRIKAATRRDRSSQGVRSWVVEFKKTRRGKSLIAFDSLFKDALLPSGQIKTTISQRCEEEPLILDHLGQADAVYFPQTAVNSRVP